MKNILLTLTTFSIGITSVVANELEPLTDTTKSLKIAEKPASKHWYETISLKGYAQVRYNRLGETNPNLKCAQCDGYWGNNTGVSFRRARLTFSGQLSPRVYFYFQNDIAQTVAASGMSGAMQSNGTLLNLTQIRDAYFDVNLNKSGSMRIRLGQSKVPFGFDVLQSSQNRLSFDRSDAINSGVYNERDLGAFFMYSPESKKKLFASLVKENLKGSGDYGVFAFGLTPRITRPAKRPQRSEFSMLTFSLSCIETSTGVHLGAHNAAPVIADTSRAIPMRDKQSALLGVSLITKI